MATSPSSNNNVFVNPQNLVDLGLAALRQKLVLTNLVWTNPVADWSGRPGDAVSVRIDAIANDGAKHFTLDGNQGWRGRTNDVSQNIGPDGFGGLGNNDTYHNRYGARPEIIVGTVHESVISMQIDDIVYDARGVTDEQMTLDIKDFGKQVVAPQVRNMAEAMDAKVANLMANAPYQTSGGLFEKTKLATVTNDPGSDNNNTGSIEDQYGAMADEFLRVLLEAKTTLDKKYVPADGRTLVATPEVIFILLQSKRLTQSSFGADQIAVQALREASVGTLFGFNIVLVNDPALPAYSAFLFHRSAFILTTIAPKVPSNAPFGATNSAAGFAMRWVQDYDTLHMEDRSVFTVYTGATSVNDGGAYGVTADANKNVRAVYIDCSSFSQHVTA